MKICLVSNIASHYRSNVYSKIANRYKCDFYFNKGDEHLKRMDYSLLNNQVKELDYWHIGNVVYQRGAPKLAFNNYDRYIVMGAPYYISTWILLFLLLFFPKKKIYLWEHGAYGDEGFLKRIIENLFHKMANGLLLYGHYAETILLERGVSPQKMFILHNSLDYDKQLEFRNTIQKSNIYVDHFGNDNYVLVMIGRLNLRKNLGILIEAIYNLKQAGEFYNVVIIGDGEDRNTLEQMCIRLNIERQVWFYGACYDESKNAELLYNADMCVVPGDIGLTAIHSLMFGVPVLTHDNFPSQGPEFEAIKPCRTGLFYKYNSLKSLEEKISEWFKVNESRRQEIRENCYHEIDTQWTPEFQMEVIKKALTSES